MNTILILLGTYILTASYIYYDLKHNGKSNFSKNYNLFLSMTFPIWLPFTLGILLLCVGLLFILVGILSVAVVGIGIISIPFLFTFGIKDFYQSIKNIFKKKGK